MVSRSVDRSELLGVYAEIKRRIANFNTQLLRAERELASIRDKVHDLVTFEGAIVHDGYAFLVDPSDHSLLVVPCRAAEDLDHPDPEEVFKCQVVGQAGAAAAS